MFGEYTPDLTGTIWTQQQYQHANLILRSFIEPIEPTWLENPTGPVGLQWRSEGQYPAAFLMGLTDTLVQLDRNITKKSRPVLDEKIRELLRTQSERQFEEKLTELQLGSHIAHGASPIAMEPCVPEELLNSSNKPPSPDFAIRLPDADVFIEVTVFRFGIFDRWDRRVNQLKEEISNNLLNAGIRRAIVLRLPIAAGQMDLSRESKRELFRKLRDLESGEVVIAEFGCDATVKWAALPHVASMDPAACSAELSQVDTLFESLGVQPGNIAFTSGPVVQPAVSISKQLVPTEGLENLLLRSIRNTLDGKRVQFPNEGHYLLAIKLGDHRLLPAGFLKLTLDRIWNNPDYAWITGLCFFSPREDFSITAPPSPLVVTFNPNTRHKATQALIDLFEGRRTFHLP